MPLLNLTKMTYSVLYMANKKQVVVAVSGGFDPIHVGHIRMFQEAKKLGDKLVVILNNDNWLKKKKTHVFMPQKERRDVIRSIQWVDDVVLTNHGYDPKDMSVSAELLKLKPDIFANGGDRNIGNVPELEACKAINCKAVFNIGRGGKVQSSSWLLANYIRSLNRTKQINVDKIIAQIKQALKISKTSASLNTKLILSEIILNVMNRRRAFGLFIILGWHDKWKEFIDTPDSGQDIYKKHHVNLKDLIKEGKHYRVESTLDFDGAILIDKNGNILDSGIIIEGLRPRIIANKIHPGKFKDLSEQFGFKGKVHSRHLSAIAASYIFKGTTVFTVSEENDSFHVFENGRIVYSL